MKKKITITIDRDYLIYDIMNKTNLLGKARKGLEGYTPELVAKLIASEDDDDMDQINRSVKSASALLMMHLAEYMTGSAGSADNRMSDDEGDIVYVLYMPSNFNEAVVQTITDSCHKYMVDKCCFDWYSLKSSADAVAYTKEMEADVVVLREAISQRTRPSRPCGHRDMPEDPEDPEESDDTPENPDETPEAEIQVH